MLWCFTADDSTLDNDDDETIAEVQRSMLQRLGSVVEEGEEQLTELVQERK